MTGGERFPRPFLWANAKGIRIAVRLLPQGSCGFDLGVLSYVFMGRPSAAANRYSKGAIGLKRSTQRRLFCDLSPTAYRISVWKCRLLRHLKNALLLGRLARHRRGSLPELVYRHKALIRRRLGDVSPELQENKAVNLALAAPKISGIVIRPGQVFSFWALVGSCTRREGYREGLVFKNGKTGQAVGGGMCQFTNLIHWMILHTPMEICEHHHHDGADFFPDYGRQVPFGTGTSIAYNYLDYRFRNTTDRTYQLVTWVDGEYLCGELRSDRPQPEKYHIHAENEFFSVENNVYYRNGEIRREQIDRRTGNTVGCKVLRRNHARVLYDAALIAAEKIRM